MCALTWVCVSMCVHVCKRESLFVCIFVKDYTGMLLQLVNTNSCVLPTAVTRTKHFCLLGDTKTILSCWSLFYFVLNYLCYGSRASYLISHSFFLLSATVALLIKIYGPVVTDCDILESYNTVPVTALLQISLHGLWLKLSRLSSDFPDCNILPRLWQGCKVSWCSCFLHYIPLFSKSK